MRRQQLSLRVESTLGQLEDDMRSNRALLEDLLRTTNQIPSSAYHSLASRIKNLKGVIRTISKLSRVLALRQVLSEAYCSILDDVTDGQYKEKAGLRESWRLNNLGLPGPGYGADVSPSTADPAVVETLADMSQDWPTKNYLQLPTLLACTLCSLSWTVAPFDPEARMFHNGMHHLTFCTKALAIGLDEATQSGYGTSSDAASSAPGFLEWFATAAAAVTHNMSESVSVMSARYRADVNAPTEEGASPLHVASAGGHASVVHEILSASASVNSKTVRGWTALHAAAQVGNPTVVRELM